MVLAAGQAGVDGQLVGRQAELVETRGLGADRGFPGELAEGGPPPLGERGLGVVPGPARIALDPGAGSAMRSSARVASSAPPGTINR